MNETFSCEGSHHSAGTQGHDGGEAAFKVHAACPSCDWTQDVAICAGRAGAVRSSSCTMTCPVCGHTSAWQTFWRSLTDLPARAAAVDERSSVVLIEAFAGYLESRRRAPGTIKQRTRHVRLLAAEHPQLDAVTPEQLDAWSREQARGKQPATVNTIIKSLRVFYAWADRFGVIRPNPATLLDLVPNPHRMGRTVDDETLERVLGNADPNLRAMLLLGRLAGLRLTELTTLHTDAVDGEWMTIVGKGSQQRRVFIVPELRTALDAIAPTHGGYYFPGRYGGHLHPQSVNKIITRESGFNPHALRHAAGTAIYASTKDLRATQAFLGHASPNTTSIYVHVTDDTIRSAAEAGARRPLGYSVGVQPPRSDEN